MIISNLSQEIFNIITSRVQTVRVYTHNSERRHKTCKYVLYNIKNIYYAHNKLSQNYIINTCTNYIYLHFFTNNLLISYLDLFVRFSILVI